MDVFGIGFLILISLLGGLIAIFADNLGRTLGKKRLTFMKMRPRRTAQVFTFAAGAVIPLLSVGAVMWLSKDVRQWFAEGPGLIKERDDLLGDVKELEGQSEGLTTEIGNKTRQLERQTAQIADKEKQIDALNVKLANSLKQVSTLTSQAKEAGRRLAQLRGQVTQLTADYRRLQARLASANVTLTKKQDEVQKLQQSYNILDADIRARDEYAISLQNEIEALEQTIKDSKAQIEALKKERDDQKAAVEVQKTQYDRDLAAKQRELELASLELDRRRGELRAAEQQLQQISSIALDSRRLPMMFRFGEEVARVQVGANLNKDTAMDGLTRLVRIARTDAEGRGAKSKGAFPSAGIMERFDPESSRMISAEEQTQRIISRISGISEPLVLIATSTVNSFMGEPVSLDIQYFRNPVIFTQGELIAEGRVDGDRSEEIVVDQISEFVRAEVKKKAKEGGMLPTLGIPEGYGEMSQNTLLALMRSAKANDRRVRIQAFASKDIRAGDPLALDYRIR